MRRELAIVFAPVVLSLVADAVALAQATAPPPLKDQVTAQFKLAKVGAQSGQIVVKEPGTVLAVQQTGLQGAPLGDLAMPTAQCKDGVLHSPSRGSSFGASMLQGMSRPRSQMSGHEFRAFPVVDKVYVSKIDVNLKNDKILFALAECAECNGANDAYKAAVSFQFAKGFLQTADVPEVEDVIVSFDTSTSQAPQAAPPHLSPSHLR